VIEARLFYFYASLQDNLKCSIYLMSKAIQVLWQDNIFAVPKIFILRSAASPSTRNTVFLLMIW